MPVPPDTQQEASERRELMRLMDTLPYRVPSRRVNENLILDFLDR